MRARLFACTLTLAVHALALHARPPHASAQSLVVEDGDAGDEIPAAELRALPEAPCARLVLALSELDRQDARGGCLASVRLANRQDRIDEGVVLLGFGLLSAIAGAAITGVGANDGSDFMTSFGLGTMGWGIINAAFSLALFDLAGTGIADIEAERHLSSEALLRAREQAAAAQDATATIIAVNAGLDVFYVATGILLYVIGAQAQPEDRWLTGYGLAMAGQGAALLAYDGVTWAFASDRASRLRALLRE